MEFHIARNVRERLNLDELLFGFTGNVIFANVTGSRKLAQGLSAMDAERGLPGRTLNAGALFAMGLIDELSHALVAHYRKAVDPNVLSEALEAFRVRFTAAEIEKLLVRFTDEFPNVAVYRGQMTAEEWLAGSTEDLPHREAELEELLLLWLANGNPAFAEFKVLFEDAPLRRGTAYPRVTSVLPDFFASRPPVAPGLGSLLEALRAPMLASPDSLTGQLEYIRETWAPILGAELKRVLLAIDVLREEEIAIWMRFHPAGPDWHRHGEPGRGNEGFQGDEYVGFEDDWVTGADGVRRRRYAHDYQAPLVEYEAFSADQAWMPNVVLIAKNTYVWLEQLSKKYQRHISRLDQIPDEELRILASRGISGLWLIGLWERSKASKTIKRLRGNPDAVASAYSLQDYLIAEDLGGEAAYVDLRERSARAGLRLASDMVPNHMGIDSTWVIEHPEWFLSRWESPFPSYGFEGPDLSTDSRVEIKLEDHYYDQSDAAVVFRIRHHQQGTTRFMYHGNDGTTFAWNDTAQLDYSKESVREHVIQVILDVARRFPIIRFDAAMVLAKRHVQRLWFPLPGAGGSIPSRAEDAVSQEQFDALMPLEFWREVVDRVAAEVPGTLLLAEAFWLLEGYFVRTLGMHRVYNSAFMNMLRDEENAKYRSYLKKTVEFDPDILKRYVNFMSNPDERTAIDQFGSGDKYFGTSVLLATLPGLPMFGHGQVEGYGERYGMDFKQARMDEQPNEGLVARHMGLIAPLLKRRALFADSANFVMYDFWNDFGTVDENVFAYSNRTGDERAVIFFNNRYESTHGTIHGSVGFLDKHNGELQTTSLARGIALPDDDSNIVAFRDVVVGLEYLRRGREFRDSGLTLPLRGYQHVVLLDWRVLQPSAAEPWDRLCDALHGSGVYSVEEALREMRTRPLREALRQAISSATIETFARASREVSADADTARQTQNRPSSAAAKAEEPDAGDMEPLQPELAELKQKQIEPELNGFAEKASVFGSRLAELWSAQAGADARPEKKDESVSIPRALELPALVDEFPAELQPAARTVYVATGTNGAQAKVWAPVLAWLLLSEQAEALRGREVFDGLNLRAALAETFSSVGLQGEAAWRAAAQVRLLTREKDVVPVAEALATAAFWRDPDVRWLIGVTGAEGEERFDPAALAQLVCWLRLPELLDGNSLADSDIDEQAREANGSYALLLKSLERGIAAATTTSKQPVVTEESAKEEVEPAVEA